MIGTLKPIVVLSRCDGVLTSSTDSCGVILLHETNNGTRAMRGAIWYFMACDMLFHGMRHGISWHAMIATPFGRVKTHGYPTREGRPSARYWSAK